MVEVLDKTFLLLVVTVANKTQFRLSPVEISRYYAVTALRHKDKDKEEPDAATKGRDLVDPKKPSIARGLFLS